MGIILRIILWCGSVLHFFRRIILDLLTLAVLVGIGLFLTHLARTPKVPSGAILVVAPKGRLIYNYREDSWHRLLAGMIDQQNNATLIRTLTASIERAAVDPRIKLMELDLRGFDGGSLTQLLSVAKALADFRRHGKSIYVYSPSYGQGTYLLAAQANHVFLNPLGSVEIDGYGDYHAYFKKILDRFGVTVDTFRVGKYKSAVEPFIRSGMSQSARDENNAWLKTWWSIYRENVSTARKMKMAQITDYANQLPELIAHANGNAAELALQYGLIDQVASWHEYEKAVAAAAGYTQPNVVKVNVNAYGEATFKPVHSKSEIAVVPVDGILLESSTPVSGSVVTGATAAQLDYLVDDREVRAVVLQVNSPGGSVTTAEAIREAVLRLRAAGKPVVVSMGTLGASGAYLVSSAAQTIFVHRTTITADIGVFALLPNVSKTLNKVGIEISGVRTSPFAGQMSPLIPLNPKIASGIQKQVDYLYQRFVQQVAEGRKLSVKDVDQIAQGRAWSGEEAVRLRLADQLGGMDKALAAAAKLAHLAPGKYHVSFLQSPGQVGLISRANMLSAASMGNSFPSFGLMSSLISTGDAEIDSSSIKDAFLILQDASTEHYFDFYPVAVGQ